MTPKEIKRLSYLKALKLEKLMDAVEKRIEESSSELTKIMLRDFLNKLEAEQGRIISRFNRATLTLFNQSFKKYIETVKDKLIKSIVGDIDSIVSDNDDFYKKTISGFDLDRSDIKKIINDRLGILEDGSLRREGYMNGLLDDASIRSDLVKYIMKEMFKSTGVESFRKGIQTFIQGEPEKFGAFQRHYRGFSHEVYAQLNSFTSALYAQKLGLNFFIYNGGLIKTSRQFCRKRNGEIYTTEEAEKWKDDPTLTAIDNRETYNWLIERGGYNCRHTIDFIAQEVAVVLRPDLNENS